MAPGLNFIVGFFPTPYRERLLASPIAQRLARGALWSLLGSLCARGLTLISSVVVARVLGAGSFGKLGMVQSTVGTFGTFSGLGLGLTGTKYVSELRTKDPHKAGRIIALMGAISTAAGAISAVVLFLLAPWLAKATLKSGDLEGMLRICAPLLLFSALTGAQVGILSGFESFRRAAFINLASGLITFPITVLATFRFHLYGAAAGLVCAQITNWALNLWALRAEAARWSVPICFKGCWKEIAILGKFSLPAYLSGLLLAPAAWCSATILVHQTNGYSELGLFNAANLWRAVILFVPNTLLGSTLPVLSNLHSSGSGGSLWKVVRASLVLNVGLALFLAALVAIFAPQIMTAYGRQFATGGAVLVIIACACVVDSLTNVLGYLLIATGRIVTHCLILTFWALMLISASFLLIPKSASKGMAVAFLAAQCAYAGALLLYS